jgi:hypothetical protein
MTRFIAIATVRLSCVHYSAPSSRDARYLIGGCCCAVHFFAVSLHTNHSGDGGVQWSQMCTRQKCDHSIYLSLCQQRVCVCD